MNKLDTLRSLWGERSLGAAWALYQEHRVDSQESEWHLLGALVAWARRENFGARWSIERAASLQPEGEILGKIRFTYGIICRELGDRAEAIQQFDAFVAGLSEYPGLRSLLLGATLYNKALALHCLGRFRESLNVSEQALEEFERESMQDYARKCLQNIAWTACAVGEAERAAEALDRAALLCTTEEANWQQRVGHAYLAYINGNHTDALQICEWVARSAETQNVPPDVQSHSAWIAAQVALEQSLFDQADFMARVAIDLAGKTSGDNRCFADATAIYTKIRRAKAKEQRKTGA